MFIPNYILQEIDGMSKEKVTKTIDVLKGALDTIFLQQSVMMEYSTLYDHVVKLVRDKHGEKLYEAVKKTYTKHTQNICKRIAGSGDADFLRVLRDEWFQFRMNVGRCKVLLLFLDDNYVEKMSSHEKKIWTVSHLGVQTFKSQVMTKVGAKLRRLVLEIIERERNNEIMADKFLLKNISDMMVEIDKEKVYREVFEVPLIKTSKVYFRKEAAKWFEGSTAVVYLQKVLKRLAEEQGRAKRCFDVDTLQKIENVIHDEMIFKYKEHVVKKEGSGVLVMLENQKVNELRLVYEALSLVDDALQPTINLLKDYIINEGLEVVKDQKKQCLDMIREVIKLRRYYEDLLLKSFSKDIRGVFVKDKDFSRAVKEAFATIVNHNDRFPEYLSLLLDKSLKRGKNQVEEESSDEFFDNVILTFHHVREKDVFEKYYKIHLAKRLLSGRSASDDAEKTFLSKLKTSFGYQFTSKLEGMFKDMKISEELGIDWKRHKKSKSLEKNFDLQVQILTHVYWPLSSAVAIKMPEGGLDRECDLFANFYIDKHTGRKISWQYSMGTADVRSSCFGRPYEFNVSTYQMVILLLYNKGENVVTVKGIHEQTMIPIPDLRRNVYALSVASEKGKKNTRLILRNSKKLEVDTRLKLNLNYKSRKIKVKVLPVVKKEDETQRQVTIEKVDEERRWIIDACIVRIMKMRKRLKHRQLVHECVDQLKQRFVPSPDIIKRRIESLIGKFFS